MAATVNARIYLPVPLRAGVDIPLDAAVSHHVRVVLRAAPGAVCRVFNQTDGEWRAELRAGPGKRMAARPLERLRPAPDGAGRGPWLCFAPVKKQAMDVIIRMATELGAARLKPVLTARTETTRINLDRLTVQAREATEQCEGLCPPVIEAPLPLAALLEGWPADRVLFACLERAGAPPLAQRCREVGACGVLVGPEGGFDDRDLDLLRRFDFVHPVSLGERILRVETAVAAALAILANGAPTAASKGS